ncbi:MAG TPA: hypothetical protein VHE61_16315 [Opitutaceae bacterium]|nr:hypothetical protein [Opitutaceae bacterium]
MSSNMNGAEKVRAYTANAARIRIPANTIGRRREGIDRVDWGAG